MGKSRSKSVATHERFSGHDAVKGSSDRSFGFVFAAFFTLVGLWPLLAGNTARWWALAIAVIFAGVALVRPSLLAPLNRLWFKIGLLLNQIVSPVVMGLLFYLVITPIALFMRAKGKDILHLKYDAKARSYWILREPPGPAPETIKNQY
jgi:predicted membrane metal-binding protein